MLVNNKTESLLGLSGLNGNRPVFKEAAFTPFNRSSFSSGKITSLSSCPFFIKMLQSKEIAESAPITLLILNLQLIIMQDNHGAKTFTLRKGLGWEKSIRLSIRNVTQIGCRAEETLLRGEETFLRGEETFLRGEETFLRGEETFLRGEETFLRGEETFLRGEETFLRGEETFLRGEETFLRGEEAFLRGEETFLRGEETFLKGEEAFLKGEETFLKGEETLRKGKKTLGRNEDIFLMKNNKCESKIYTKGNRRQI